MNQHIQLIIKCITYIFIVFLLTQDICNLLVYFVVQQAQGIAKSGAESPNFNICTSIPQKPFFICFEKCKLVNKKWFC